MIKQVSKALCFLGKERKWRVVGTEDRRGLNRPKAGFCNDIVDPYIYTIFDYVTAK
jgi:hypothetical protein